MRLAYLTSQYPKVSHTFIRREIRELERRGHRVLRFAVRPPSDGIIDPLDLEEERQTTCVLDQPRTVLLAAFLGVLLRRPVSLVRALRLALVMGAASERGSWRHLAYLVEACFLRRVLEKQGVDHIHVHFGTNAAAVALLVRRLGGPTYSLTIHGPVEFDAPVGFSLREKVEAATFTAAISDFTSAQIRRWIDPSQWAKVRVVRCSVAESFLEEASPVDPSARSIVCVGRLTPQKGQITLLDALAEVVKEGIDGHLLLVGDGEMRSTLERHIAQAGLESRVHITGWLDEGQVRQTIAASRCLALPSFAEGLPVVIMEAFALGRPVVTTTVAGIPELVRHRESGWLVPPGNVTALAGALREAYLAGADVLTAMGRAGRVRVQERHRLATEVSKLEALLSGLDRPDSSNPQKRTH